MTGSPLRHAFDAELARIPCDEDLPTPAPTVSFLRGVADLAGPVGGHSLWERAAAWTPEADPTPPPPAPPTPSADPEDIAAELALPALATAADVARARRRFMWDNHPDRRRDIDGDLATQRGAVANMLLDGRLADLLRTR